MNRLITGLLLLLSIATIGCSSSTSGGNIKPPAQSYGNARITLTWPHLQTRAIGEITKIRLTVTATGMNQVVKDLPVSLTDSSTSTVVAIPAGNDRVFTVQGLDGNDATIYSGSTTANVIANNETVVTVTLAPVPVGVNIDVNVHTGPPVMSITDLPSISSGGTVVHGQIGGGVNPADLAVTVYVKVSSGWWGPKPYLNSPLTAPLADGSWATRFVTGGIDSSATEIIAFLVWKTASPPARGGGMEVPVVPGALFSVTGTRAP